VIYYTEPRYTKDLDVWIESSLENAQKIYMALKEFGAPLENITIEDFTNINQVYQIGIAPVRADILMGIKGMAFSTAWKKKVMVTIEGVEVNIIGFKELMVLKKHAARDVDKRDLRELKYRLKRARKK
jgi:predicted nucleotidyltransferase